MIAKLLIYFSIMENLLGRIGEEGLRKCILKSSKELSVSSLFVTGVLDEHYPGLDSFYHDGVKEFHRSITFANELYTPASMGARKGDVLIGIKKVTKNATLTITGSDIPPSKASLDEIRKDSIEWKSFIMGLSSYSFFKGMAYGEKVRWLRENQRDDVNEPDFDMAEVKGSQGTFSSFGESLALTSNLELEKDYSLLEARSLFPTKPGSKARRNTLYFFLHYWKIVQPSKPVAFRGTSYKYPPGIIESSNSSEKYFVIPTGVTALKTIGIEIDGLISDSSTFEPPVSANQIVKALSFFTPSGLKSLIQKIIRVAPFEVDICGVRYDVELVLKTTLIALWNSPGSFVPDIQRFVTGKESVFKRLVVSVVEDGWYHDYNDLVMLLVCALAFQKKPDLGCELKLFEKLIEVALYSVRSRNRFLYSRYIHSKTKTIGNEVTSKDTSLMLAAKFLKDLRSFHSDEVMFIDIAEKETGSEKEKSKIERPTTMNFVCSIDQHWIANFVYLADWKWVSKHSSEGGYPLDHFFRMVWDTHTGINSRKALYTPQKKILKLQHLTYSYLSGNISSKYNTLYSPMSDGCDYVIELSSQWLAGLLGAIEVKAHTTWCLVTLNSDGSSVVPEWNVVRRPSREPTDASLSKKIIETAILEAKKILTKGIGLTGCTPPIDKLKGSRLYLTREEELRIGLVSEPKKFYKWDDVCSERKTVNTFEVKKIVGLEDPYPPKNFGVIKDSLQDFVVEVLSAYPKSVGNRFYSYISQKGVNITLPSISRDGGGTEKHLSLDDIAVHNLLNKISKHFPYLVYPTQKGNGYSLNSFDVNYHFITEMEKVLISQPKSNFRGEWKYSSDSKKRKLKDYQIEALEELKETNKGFLWLPPGAGKTLIVAKFLIHSIKSSKAPKFVIYTLPKSAIESVLAEIKYFGFDVNFIIPIAGWKKRPESKYSKNREVLLPFHINFIEHDDLRKAKRALFVSPQETFVIVDEVHKTFNDTQRTDVALELSRVSASGVVLTGTAVIDTKLYKLASWLKGSVDFEITDKNFWVAASAMISKNISTGIKKTYSYHPVVMSSNIKKKYESLIPPILGGSNEMADNSSFSKAIELCYGVCLNKMVDRSIDLLKQQTRCVMIVVKNSYQQHLFAELLLKKGVNEDEILVMGKESVLLESNDTSPIKVVVVPVNKSAGYTLTKATVMLTSVYFTNFATRKQLEGRIDRISQTSPEVFYEVYFSGILEKVMHSHILTSNLSGVLSTLSK